MYFKINKIINKVSFCWHQNQYIYSKIYVTNIQYIMSAREQYIIYLRNINCHLHSSQIQSIHEQLQIKYAKDSPTNFIIACQKEKKEVHSDEDLIGSILITANQANQINIDKINLKFFSLFIKQNKERLKNILLDNYELAKYFCFSIMKLILQYQRIQSLQQFEKCSGLTDLIAIFLQILHLQSFKCFSMSKSISSYRQSDHKKKQIGYLFFQFVLVLTSVKYVRENDEIEFNENKLICQLINSLQILIRDCKGEKQFPLIRNLFKVCAYLIIFNKSLVKPISYYQFIFQDDKRLSYCQNNQTNFQILPQQSLELYEKLMFEYFMLDPSYYELLLKIVDNMISLQFHNVQIVTFHFMVFINIINRRVMPKIKGLVYFIILERCSNSKNQKMIDALFDKLMEINSTQLVDFDTQQKNIIIAQLGGRNRKTKLLKVYFQIYKASLMKLTTRLVNFILEINLEYQTISRNQFLNIFIRNELKHFTSESIKKIHTYNQQNMSLCIAIVACILQSINQNDFYLLSAYIRSQNFEAVGNISEICCLYLDIIVKIITSRTITIKPQLLNISSKLVNIIGHQSNKFKRATFEKGKQFYLEILKAVIGNKIKGGDKLIKYLVLCQAIFETTIQMKNFGYFVEAVKNIEDLTFFLVYLEYIISIFKNKVTLLLYFQILLTYYQNNRQKKQIQQQVYNLSFLCRFMSENKYFKIHTYSIEALSVIFEMKLFIQNQKFQKQSEQILRNWSSFIKTSDIRNLCYFFSIREIKKIYPHFHSQQYFQSSKKIASSFSTILYLLSQRCQKVSKFICSDDNQIQILLKKVNQPKSYKVILNLVKNINVSSFLSICFLTAQEKLRIHLKNDKIYVQKVKFEQKQQKIELLKNEVMKQTKKHSQKLFIEIIIKEHKKSSIIEVYFQQNLFFEYQIHPQIQQVDFGFHSPFYIQDFLFKDYEDELLIFQNPENRISINNGHQLKIKSVVSINQSNFIEKFDFEHMFSLIIQLLNNFQKHLALSWVYNYCLNLAFFMVTYEKQNQLSQILKRRKTYFLSKTQQLQFQVKCMNSLFRMLLAHLKNKMKLITERKGQFQYLKKVQLPTCLSNANYIYTPKFIHFLLSTTVNKQIWCWFCDKDKDEIINFLNLLIFDSTFKNLFENKRLDIFFHLIEMIGQKGDQLDFKLMNLCHNIIKNHEPNTHLTQKFDHYIYFSLENNFLQENLSSFLSQLVTYPSNQEENIGQKVLTQFLLIENINFEMIFSFCTFEAKERLIYEIQNRTPQVFRIIQLFKLINIEQRNEAIFLLFQLFKQLFLKLKNANFSCTLLVPNDQNLKKGIGKVVEIIFEWWNNINEQNLQQSILKYICTLLEYIKSKIKHPSHINQNLQKIVSSNGYLKFLIYLIEQLQIKKIDQKNSNKKKIIKQSLNLFPQFSKQNMLIFMNNYRVNAKNNLLLLLFPLKYDLFKTLAPNAASVMLQYIIQTLIIIQMQSNYQKKQMNEFYQSIRQYLFFLIKHFEGNNKKIKNAIYYIFPKMMSAGLKLSDQDQILNLINQFQSQSAYELKGGIFLKIFIIVFHLIKIFPDKDLSDILQLLLFSEIKDKRNQKAIERAILDFNPGPILAKDRNRLDQIYAIENQEHKNYCMNEDQPYSNNSNMGCEKIDGDDDLSPYFIDYVIMKISILLIDENLQIDKPLVKKYSDIVTRVLDSYPRVRKDINESNTKSFFTIFSYKDLVKVTRRRSSYSPSRKNSKASKNQIHTPVVDFDTSSPNFKNADQNQFIFANLVEKVNFGQQSYNSPVKKVQHRKSFDLTIRSSSKKTNIIQDIKKDSQLWHTKLRDIQFSHYFCDKAKQILIRQLLHQYYVHLTTDFEERQNSLVQAKRYIHPFKIKYNQFLIENAKKQQLKCAKMNQNRRRIRKIYPYTCIKRPTLKIMSHMFSNLTTPVTYLVPGKDYKIKRFKNLDSLNVERHQLMLEQQKINLNDQVIQKLAMIDYINLGDTHSNEDEILNDGQSTNDLRYCQVITRKKVFFCEWIIKDTLVIFTSKGMRVEVNIFPEIKYGAPEHCISKDTARQFSFHLEDIQQIFYRKFNQILNNSIQIFLKNGKSRFINFYVPQQVQKFIGQICKIRKDIYIAKDLLKQFQKLEYMDKWAEGHISNFDYLMLINKFSGRTYNDLNQYYVFPWVLSDYNSSRLDLSNREVFRALSLPIGALNPQKLKRYKEKYRNQSDNQKCLYGSHYSTSLFIYYYLVRIQPFSTLHHEMQSGRFDSADRLFNSIEGMWQSLVSESVTADVKQSIPQFYYLPAFLKNCSHIDFGNTQTGKQVENVQLPKWAKSAQHFIVCMRAALQSDYVSQNLHNWIDLIFGKYQKSIEKVNLFHPISYQENIDFRNINPRELEGLICQINYFGQNPIKIFKKEHRPKQLSNDKRFLGLSFLRSKSSSIQQKQAHPQFYVSQLTSANYVFYLKLKHRLNSQIVKNIAIDISVQITEIQHALRNIDLSFDKKNKLKRQKSNENEKINEYIKYKPQIIQKVNKAELIIGNQAMRPIEINFEYSQIKMNELFIACYGMNRLKVFNWQMEEIWDANKNEIISSIYLEPTLIIYATSNGKIFLYSFFDQKETQIYSFNYPTFQIRMEVILLPKLPSEKHRNQSNYRILCVGDNHRVALFHYRHQNLLSCISR